MVKRVFRLMYGEVRGLHQAAYVLGVFAFGSQILALVRDRLLANQFGAGIELDLYYAAFKIPDLLYVLFASTLSVYVLIPFVTARQNNGDEKGARDLLSQIFSVFLAIYAILVLVLAFLTPNLVPFLFPGMELQTETLTLLIRILLLQPLLLGVSSLFGVITQLKHRFVLFAISPLIYNLGIIIGIGILYPIYGIAGLVYGVLLGALGHMLVQLPLVRESSLSFGFTTKISWPTIRNVLFVSVPRATTLAMHQIVLLVFVSVASTMTVGSVAVFQFAYNLQAVPLAVVGASYSIAAFPILADMYASRRFEQFSKHIIAALRHMMFWAIPITGLIIVLRAQMVRVVLGSGAFDWSDTKLTAAILAILVLSLCAQAFNLLIVRVFYAGGYTRVPFFVTFGGSILAVFLLILLTDWYIPTSEFAQNFSMFMRLESVPGSEVLWLAVAYSVAITIQTLILLTFATKKFAIDMTWIGKHLFHSLSATLVGSAFAYATLNFLVEGINQNTFIGIFVQGLLGGVAGLVGVVATYYVLKTPELNEVYRAFHGKLRKNTVVAPLDDVL